MKGLKRITKVISNSVSRVDEEAEVEHFFSNHPHFNITPLSSAGLPGATTCSAYDPVLGILAVGTRSGTIHILGRDNLESVLSLPHPDVPASNATSPAGIAKTARASSGGNSPISSKGILMKTSMDGLVAEPKAIVLQPGTATLACIDTVNRIVVFDLSTGECVHHARIHEGQALTLELGAPGSPWLYVGCTNGRTAVFSIDKRWMSSYLISSQAALPMVPVVALGTHPYQPNLLLIVYYDGSLAVWDLPTRKVHFKPTSVHWPTFTPANTSPTHATCAAWHPDGSQFVVGYDNGWLAIWTLGSSSATPTAVFQVPSDQPDGASGPEFDMVCPVFKLVWSLEGGAAGAADRAVIYVGGGLSDHTIVRLDYPRSTKSITSRPPVVHVIRHSPVFGLVSDFLVLSSIPWIPTNPRAVITLSDLGDAIAYEVSTPPPAASPGGSGQLRQFTLPITLALGTMGNVKSVAHQYVHPAAMNDIMDLQGQCNALTSQVPLGWWRCFPDSIAPGARVPEHALATLITESGVHVLDLTSSPPAKLPGLFVPFELLKAVIVDHLPRAIVEDPTMLAEWHVGLKLAWAVVDWKVPRMVVGCENGMLVEMLCRKYMVAGTEAEGKRVRVRSLDELGVDGRILVEKEEATSMLRSASPAPAAGTATTATESGDQAADQKGGACDGGVAGTPLPALKPALHTSATDVSTWIPLALTRTQFHAFRDRVFLPYRIMIPKRPTRTQHAALFDGMLAVMTADGTVDVFDTHSEVHVTQLDLAPICDEIAREMAAEHAKKAGNKLLSRSRLVSTDPEGMDEDTNCKPTCVKWHRGMDDTLRLLIGCSGHVFVYALEDETIELQTCLRDKGDVPVLDVVLIPDVEAYEAAARMHVATLRRNLSEGPEGLKEEEGGPRLVPLASGEGKGSGALRKPKERAQEEKELHPMLDEPTMVVVTRDSIRVLDLDDFQKLHSWKPNLERHGHIIRMQPLNDPTTPTASQSNLHASRRRSPTADDDTPEMQLMVVTEIAVVILTYPYLEFVADMSHGIKALDKDRVAATLDAHLLHIEGDNRVHVLGCRKDTSWAVHPRLHFPRPAAAAAPDRKGGEEADMEGMLMPASGASNTVPLVPLPPRPAQPTSVFGSLLSYLPFGSSDASDGSSAAGLDGMSARDAAMAKQLNDAFGVVDQATVGANAAAHQAMDALRKRGDKLEMLEQKFSQLSEGTSQFAKMAKQIREAEEKKKWYHF